MSCQSSSIQFDIPKHYAFNGNAFVRLELRKHKWHPGIFCTHIHARHILRVMGVDQYCSMRAVQYFRSD